MAHSEKKHVRFRHAVNNFFLFSLIFFIGVSCSKGSIPGGESDKDGGNSESYTLKHGVISFEGANTQFIQIIDDEILVIKNEAPSSMKPKTGDVIFVAQSKEAPYGFMGRVQNVIEANEDMELQFEAVSIEEVFEELHIDKSIDISEQLDELVDDEGNPVSVKTVDNSFWEQFELEDADDNDTNTKSTTSSNYIGITKSISLSAPFFEGGLILSSDLNAKINLSKGHLQDYSVTLKTATSISGSLQVQGSQKKSFSKTVRLPGAVMVGPIALRPAIVLGLDLETTGEIKMNGPINIGLSSTTTKWENAKETQTVIDNSHPVTCDATYIDCNGTLSINGSLGLQFGVFGQKLLAFGVDWQPDLSISLSGEMRMADKKAMMNNPSATISGSFGSFGAYLYSKFFSKNLQDKVRVSVQTPKFEYVIPLFDKGKKHSCIKSVGNWSLNGEYGDKALLSIDEEGYALFKIGKEDPIEIQARPAAGNAVKSGDDIYSFTIPENPFNYYVRTLNTVVDSGTKYYFYGPIVGPLISSLNMDMPYFESSMFFSFQYDDFGRCEKVTRTDDGVFYYTINYVYKGETIDATWSDGGFEEITVDSKGRLVSCVGTDNFGAYRNRQVSYNGNNVIISIKTDTDEANRSLSYSNGDLVKQVINRGESYSYSYADYPNNYSIDFTHYLLDDMGGSLTLPPFLAFPGISNRHLLKSPLPGWLYPYSAPFSGISYDFDEHGRMTRLSSSPHVDIQFTYVD